MKSKTLFGALLVSVALCSQGFAIELGGRLAGLKCGGCGACEACAQPACCEQAAKCCAPEPACCEKACGTCTKCCKPTPVRDLFSGLKDMFECRKCCAPACGACCPAKACCPEPACCEKACPAPACCEKACCEPACGCGKATCRKCHPLLDRLKCKLACAKACCAEPACCEKACCAAPACCEKACPAPACCEKACGGCETQACGRERCRCRLSSLVNKLFACKRCCRTASCETGCCETGCGAGCNGGAPAAAPGAPKAAPEAAPLPKAPKATEIQPSGDPSASLIRNRSLAAY